MVGFVDDMASDNRLDANCTAGARQFYKCCVDNKRVKCAGDDSDWFTKFRDIVDGRLVDDTLLECPYKQIDIFTNDVEARVNNSEFFAKTIAVDDYPRVFGGLLVQKTQHGRFFQRMTVFFDWFVDWRRTEHESLDEIRIALGKLNRDKRTK